MENENKKHMKRDLLLVAVILVIAAAGLLINQVRRQPAPPSDSPQDTRMDAYVEISIDGKIIETLDLSQNTQITVSGYNNGSNHLIIEDGQVWIDDASCPDKLCIHQGKISKNSDLIVCLPNLMIAQIRITDTGEPADSSPE